MEGALAACEVLAEGGVVGLVGPVSTANVKAANHYPAAFNVPHMAPAATDPSLANTPP